MISAPQANLDPEESDNQQAMAGIIALLMFFPFFHHLWFLWFLCLLVAAFAVYAGVLNLTKFRLPGWMATSPLRYAWLIPLAMIPQSMMGLLFPSFGPDTSSGLLPIPSVLFYYAIFFFFGAIYFDCDDQSGRVGRWWRFTLPIALLVVFPIGYELTVGGLGFGERLLDYRFHRPASVLLQVVYAWMMTFGLMGMFRSLMSTESRTMRYISDSSYWLYLAHLPLIIVAQAIVRDWQIPALAKLALICTVCSLLLLASYQFIRPLHPDRHTPERTAPKAHTSAQPASGRHPSASPNLIPQRRWVISNPGHIKRVTPNPTDRRVYVYWKNR